MSSSSSRRVPRVLHVTETFSSGVATAVHSFVENSPQAEHHLLASVRDGAGVKMSEQHGFVEMIDLPRGMRAACGAILREVRRLRPDFVHVHCAYAGVYVRLLPIARRRIIYSPHCFPFERESDSLFSRAAYVAVEALLALRTGAFGAVSRAEARLCERFPGRSRVVTIPNVSHLVHRPRLPSQVPGLKPVVSFNGRLSPQKDPMFLVRALERAPTLAQRIEFVWIGSGEPEYVRALESVGVRVTGWLSLDQVQDELLRSDVYAHVARWEGFPMSVLEAAALDVPVIARSIRAFEGYGFPRSAFFGSPEAFIDCMEALLADRRSVVEAGQAFSAQVRQQFDARAQAEALRNLYGAEEVKRSAILAT
jgi:glycosyltransferase involved in cell wall biosynthesis